MVVVAKTQRSRPNAKCIKHLSPAVKESEPKVCQLGSLLVLNIFSICSQPNFCLSCSLWQNPPTTISNCHNAPYLSMSKSNPNLVFGVLLYILIKKFCHLSVNSHGVLAHVLFLLLLFLKIYQILFSIATVNSWCLFK